MLLGGAQEFRNNVSGLSSGFNKGLEKYEPNQDPSRK